MNPKTALCLLLCLGTLAACSRTEPKITYGSLRMVHYEEAGRRGERLSLFVLPDDEDGIEDLAALYLYHDWEGLQWRLSPEDWVTIDFDGKTWVGSRYIAMDGNEPLPRGQFRAVLEDKGGERSERLFVYDVSEDSAYPFPAFSIEEGRFLVESAYPAHYLLCYDQEGNYVSTQPLTVLGGSLDELGLPGNVRSLALWAEDDEYNTAALTAVVPLR
ncbi:MAG: hypothetical protein LBD08_00310 [Treponema sp.]|jgi:hypothetical protein|nr:hypothetical protein [Treponema sp.]